MVFIYRHGGPVWQYNRKAVEIFRCTRGNPHMEKLPCSYEINSFIFRHFRQQMGKGLGLTVYNDAQRIE
jgi:hypothetical protein